MTISTLPTPPSRNDAPADFVAKADALLGALPTFVSEANNLADQVNAGVGAMTAGTVIQVPLVFDGASQTDADPGVNGRYRLNNANATLATFMYVDDKDSAGNDILGLLDSITSGTSATKGQLRLYKDTSNFLVYSVTGVTTATGYRKLALVYLGGAGTVSNGNAVTMYFTKTGDKGTFSGDLGNQLIQGIKGALYDGEINIATTSGAITIDWTVGHLFKQAEPTGTITYTFTAPGAKPCHLQLRILSDGTSTPQTFNFPGLGTTFFWMGAVWTPVTNKNAMINIYFDGAKYWAMGVNEQ